MVKLLGFNIDLVHLELAADEVPIVLKLLRVVKGAHDAGRDIDRDVEVPVIIGTRVTGTGDSEQDKKESLFHLSCYFTTPRGERLVLNFSDRTIA